MLNTLRTILRARPLHKLVLRHNSTAESPQPDMPSPDSVLAELTDYKNGLQHFYAEDYGSALESFGRVKTILENAQQQYSQPYYALLLRIARANYSIERYKSTGETLNEGLDVLRALKQQNIVLFEHYTKLLSFYMRTNLEKAILFARSIIEDEEFALMPFNFQNEYKAALAVS